MNHLASSYASSQPTSATYESLTVPTHLVTDLSDSPLAIGMYGLVARLFLIGHEPIPLSTSDVQRYDPQVSRSAIMRAFARLVRGGWIVEHTKPGCKTSYVPAWGFVNGTPRVWRMGATLLDRPRRTAVVLLQKRLLDTCIGRLVPHPTNPATVERYLTQPLLGLADVGTYLLLDNGGSPHATSRLMALELVRHGHTIPLASDACVLAHASQRVLLDAAQTMELTKKGLLKLGCPPASTPPEDGDHTQPLFFVAPSMFGSMTVDMNACMIGSRAHNNQQNFPLECAQTTDIPTVTPITWNKGSLGIKGNTTTLPTNTGGGTLSLPKQILPHHEASNIAADCDKYHDKRHDHTETATIQLLRSLHIAPSVISELANQPTERVHTALTDGQASPNVRNLAGWVVARLRLERDHAWNSPARGRSERADVVDWTAEIAKAQTNGLMRDTADLLVDCLSAAQEPVQYSVGVAPPVDAAAQLHAQLHAQLPELLHPLIARVTVALTDDVVSLGCSQPADVVQLQRFLPTITTVLCRLGWLRPPRIVQQALPRACAPVALADTRPPWITPARWALLPAMLRAALHGACMSNGAIQARSTYLTRLLETRYPSDIRVLLDEAVELIQ